MYVAPPKPQSLFLSGLATDPSITALSPYSSIINNLWAGNTFLNASVHLTTFSNIQYKFVHIWKSIWSRLHQGHFHYSNFKNGSQMPNYVKIPTQNFNKKNPDGTAFACCNVNRWAILDILAIFVCRLLSRLWDHESQRSPTPCQSTLRMWWARWCVKQCSRRLLQKQTKQCCPWSKSLVAFVGYHGVTYCYRYCCHRHKGQKQILPPRKISFLGWVAKLLL